MTQRFRFLLLAFAVVIGLGGSPPILTSGQESSPEATNRMVTVYPAATGPGDFATVEVNPGESQEFVVVIGNAGNIEQRIRAYPVPVTTLDNGGFAALPYGTEADEVTSWMDIPEIDLELEPGVGQEITVKVSVPEGTAPGEYVTAIAAEQAEAFEIEGTDILTQRVRQPMPVLIIVPGEFQYSFDLTAAELELRDESLIGIIQIENTGTAIVRPTGEVRLLGDTGDVIGVSEIVLNSIYTGTTANFYAAWQNVPASDSYSMEVVLTDPDNGATASATFADLVPITDRVPSAAATPVPELEFSRAEMTPLTRDEPPSTLLFEGEISNPGDPIENARVTIVTYQNGEEVDRYPIMQAVTIAPGSTPLEARYSLPGGFTEGTYTFAVTIELGSGETQTILLTETIEFEITVP